MNINKYIKQQDELVTSFTDGLTTSIGNSLSRKQDNLNLIISNQLTKLWNDSWNLGRNHAIGEQPSLFSYGNYIAEFASPLQKIGKEIKQLNDEKEGYQSELIRMRDEYQDVRGEYNANKLLKVAGKRGTYTGVDKVRAIQTIVKREDELIALIKAKDNLINKKNEELDSLIRLGQLGEVSKDVADTPEVNVVQLPRVNTAEVKQELDSASRKRDAWRKVFVDEKGNLNLALYRKRRGFDNDISDADVLTQMRIEERDLNNAVNSRVQTLRDAKPRKGISNKEQRLIERQLKQQQNLQTTKLSDDKIPANIRDSVKEIESRRQIESTIGDVPLLEQTEFGKSYLNRRINTITNDLNERYKDTLKQVVPEYLADNKQDKDITYYRRISGMLTREDSKQMELYNKQLDLINGKLKDIPSKEIAEINVPSYKRQEFRNTKYNPEVPLSPGNKKLLNELPDKAVYTREDIKSYRDKLLEKVRKLKDNQARTKRIAITEMGHAYNLGRLDYYIKSGKKFVKWNNSIEHKRRVAPGDYRQKYQRIYNKLSELINRSPQLESFKMDGIVCPICQERAIYDYGYGKGIIQVEDLLNNIQTQPLLHPACACYLTAVDTEDVNETVNVPIYISSLLNNNVVKWATAGILGTAAMYAAFKKSNLTPLNIPDIIRSKPAVVTTKALTQALLEDVPIIDVPLVPLRIPELIPSNINIDRANDVLEPILNWRANVIDDLISEATDIDDKYELINPLMVNSTKESIDRIMDRAREYKTITKANLTKANLNQFKEDVDDIQYYINEIEDGNVNLYSSIQSMKLVRKSVIDEGLLTLTDDVIPPGFTPEQVIVTNPIIQRLDNRIMDNENSLRRLLSLQYGEYSHFSRLKEIQSDLLGNELFKREYIKGKRSVLLRLQRNLTKQVLPQVMQADITELQGRVLSNYLTTTNEQFGRYVRQLDNIEFAIDNQLELIKQKLGFTSLDINYNVGKEGMAISTSEFIRDYKTGLIKSKRQVIELRNILLDVKLDIQD
jgi:hypothetical protein